MNIDQRIDGFPRWHAGAGDDEGDADRMVVQTLLAEEAVLADSQAIVGGEYDDGVVFLAGLFQGVEHAADLVVKVADNGCVFAEMGANHRLGRG